MKTRSKRTRRSTKVLAAVGAAGVALAATAAPASAAFDGSGNLVNTTDPSTGINCNAKILKGYFAPVPVTIAGHTYLQTYGSGNCFNGTNFGKGIVDIQHAIIGPNVPGGIQYIYEGAAQFNAGSWALAQTPLTTDTSVCNEYFARSRVWRKADVNNASATIGVNGGSVVGGVYRIGPCGKN